MARDDLQQNQIVPAARPVGAFIQPARQDVGAPAAPQILPNPRGISIIGQGSGPNVQGVNQFSELAEALAPFTQSVTQLATTGLKFYAEQQYQIGQNEVIKAQVLANQQILQSQGEYARENRRLAKADPIGAVMMDRVNPFREAGRQNRLARIAGAEIVPAVMRRYRSTAGVEQLAPEAPELAQLKAQAIEEVASKYRLNPSSPGFAEYVLPQIGQAGQKLTETHYDDRAKYQKNMAWRLAADEGFRVYQGARETGGIEWEEYSAAGVPTRYFAELGKDPAAWRRGVQVKLSQLSERLANETGIPGETTQLREQMIQRLYEMSVTGKNDDLRQILLGVEVGPPGKDGRRALAGSLFGLEMDEAGYKVEQRQWQRQQQNNEQGLQNFDSELADVTYGIPDGPDRGKKIKALTEKYAAMGIPKGKLMERVSSMSKTLDDVAGRSFSTDGMDSLLQGIQARVGSDWDARTADQEVESMLSTVAPQDRAKYREQYAAIRRRQEAEKDDMPLQLINPLLAAKMKANLLQHYPQDVTEAALRGADVTQMMAWGDADVAKSAQLQRLAYMKHVAARLREAAAKKGEKLDPAEITDVAGRAMEEYGTKDKGAFESMFPGSGITNAPSVGGKPRPPALPAGGGPAAAAPAVFPSGQLDNMPNRSQRLQSGAAVLARPSAQEEIQRVLSGQSPSSAVRRAAKDAGYGSRVGEWLLKQLDQYPGGPQSVPPAARRQLLLSTRGAQGTANAWYASAAPASAVARAGSWFVDALLGTRPASAITLDSTMRMPRSNFSGGGGGGRWEQGPAIAASHPDTGNGYTIPGALDANGRPAVFSRSAANAFAAMVRDSGGVVKPRDIASAQRSRGKNAAVGGVAGSQHLGGNAMDIHGASHDWIAKNGARYGWYLNRYGGAKDHGGHFEFRGGGGASEAPTTRRGGGMTGIATYYTGSGGSDGVAGGPTANGELYDPKKMTAAVQWSLRGKYLNKWVTVEDLDTGKSVKVWVNDVGQMGGSRMEVNKQDPRLIDLSPAAFKRLFGSTQRGTGRIRIRGVN